MECPQCKGYHLEPKELAAGLIAAVCSKCNGSLLSLMNYRYWLDQQEARGSIESKSTETSEVLEDSTGAKLCPKCSKFMTKYQIGSETKNKLELCTGCDESWLDKGEWQLLQQLDMQDKLPKIFTDAWQRNIRVTKQENTLKARYQEQLGKDDFSKADDFKQWLTQHPQKNLIKQYLNTTIS